MSLYYEEYGGGKDVVLIHASLTDHTMWLYQIPLLSDYFHVVAYDQRCFGRSDKPRMSFSIQDLASDLRSLISSLGLRRPCLVGLSLGGIVSMVYALKYPKSVRAMVIADTLASGDTKILHERLRRFRDSGIGGYYEAALRTLFSKRFQATSLGNYLIRSFVEKSSRLDARSLVALYRAISELDIREGLPRLTVPTLVIAGTADYAYPQSRAIADKIPRARFLGVKDVGHMTALESPQIFNNAMMKFLRRQAGDERRRR